MGASFSAESEDASRFAMGVPMGDRRAFREIARYFSARPVRPSDRWKGRRHDAQLSPEARDTPGRTWRVEA
jgi:hypothetical protein